MIALQVGFVNHCNKSQLTPDTELLNNKSRGGALTPIDFSLPHDRHARMSGPGVDMCVLLLPWGGGGGVSSGVSLDLAVLMS